MNSFVCFSRSLAVATRVPAVQDHDGGLPWSWGGIAADARAQSSRSCVRSSTDLRGRYGHSHRRTRSRSSERDRALSLRVRPPLERSAAAICGCHLSLSQPRFGQHRARGVNRRFRWRWEISSLLSAASPTSCGPAGGRSRSRWPISIDGRRFGLFHHALGETFSRMICGRLQPVTPITRQRT